MSPPPETALSSGERTDRASDAAAPAVALTGVDVEFTLNRRQRTLQALREFDLTVAPGEFVALLGPSGCGKTTVLRLVAGLQQPTRGTVEVEGRSPAELSATHRLGVAFQDSALLPWATAWNNVALPFRIAGRPVDEERVRQLFRTVRLEGFEKSRPRQLSGGMRQRISIARALALDPDVLLLDEPFGALDAVTRRRLNLELADTWAQRRTTTVLVTHDVPEAVLLADRIVVMTGRPGRCRHVEVVETPRPRGVEFTRTPEFHETVDRLTGLLDEAAPEDE